MFGGSVAGALRECALKTLMQMDVAAASATRGRARLRVLPDCIAHRGGSCDGPENTVGCLRQALEMGCDGIEFDLQRTQDDHLVILHDDTLQRTAAPFDDRVAAETGLSEAEYNDLIRANVNDLTLEQVRRVDVGSFFGAHWREERVGVFEDALELVARYPGRKVYAELKNGDVRSAELAAAAVARLRPDPEQLWFIGFSLDMMRSCKALMPEYPALHVLEPRLPVLGISEDEFVQLAVASARELDGIDPCAVPSSVTTRLAKAIRALDHEEGGPAYQQPQPEEGSGQQQGADTAVAAAADASQPPSRRRPKTVACWVWRKVPETDAEDNWRYLVDVVDVDAITTDRPRDYLKFIAANYGAPESTSSSTAAPAGAASASDDGAGAAAAAAKTPAP
jgi:glycerophosphoryl diester phosphodiesterase